MSRKDIEKALQRDGDRLLRSLQTLKARKALEKAFRASPAEMGRAALREAKRSAARATKKKR
jgi:hypothetical protein